MSDLAEEKGPVAGQGVLRLSGVVWFAAAAIGQLAFVYFIIAHYGSHTVTGNFPRWNDKPIIDGYIAGDGPGNAMFAAHVLLAAVVTFGGLLQLIPHLRARFPRLHRWNGRVFIVIAVFLALGGIWLTWIRGTHLSIISGVAITINGVLILTFAAVAWRLAAARRFDDHRRWAMRTFLVVNGVWFLRVGIMAWAILNQGPVGMNRTLSGPADIMLVFGCYLIPLAVLELYFAAQRSTKSQWKIAGALLVFLMTGIMAVGIFGTIAVMWWAYL